MVHENIKAVLLCKALGRQAGCSYTGNFVDHGPGLSLRILRMAYYLQREKYCFLVDKIDMCILHMSSCVFVKIKTLGVYPVLFPAV